MFWQGVNVSFLEETPSTKQLIIFFYETENRFETAPSGIEQSPTSIIPPEKFLFIQRNN
jgi:hypothetical protein